jgi:hypothetical protein
MQEILIYCFILIVCAMGAFVAASGPTMRDQLLRPDEESGENRPTSPGLY